MLLELERRAEAESGAEPASGREAAPVEKLKPRRPNRNQFTYAAADVEALIAPQHPARAARRRTAREPVERLEQALEELPKIAAKKKSEPEARLQRESNGGFAAGHNARLATGAKEKIVVRVELTNEASGGGQG